MQNEQQPTWMQSPTAKFVFPIAALALLLVLVNLMSDGDHQGREKSLGELPSMLQKTEQAVAPVLDHGVKTAEKMAPILTRPIDIGLDYVDKAAESLNPQTAPATGF